MGSHLNYEIRTIMLRLLFLKKALVFGIAFNIKEYVLCKIKGRGDGVPTEQNSV